MQLKLGQNKKIEILTLSPGYDGMVKKTVSRYCPFKANCMQNWIIVCNADHVSNTPRGELNFKEKKSGGYC